MFILFWVFTVLQEASDVSTQRLYHRKILPQGERAYLNIDDGIARVRTGLFAFQVSVIY